MIEALIKKYWHLVCFKEKAEEMPSSILMLYLFTVLYFVLIIVQWQLTDIDDELSFSDSVLSAFMLILAYYGYTFALLLIFSLKKRFVKTAACLIAAHFIIHVLASPLVLLTSFVAELNHNSILYLILGSAYLILYFMLSLWQLFVSAAIYRNAVDISFLQSAAASVGLQAVSILFISLWQ